jgi:hypothetical protein
LMHKGISPAPIEAPVSQETGAFFIDRHRPDPSRNCSEVTTKKRSLCKSAGRKPVFSYLLLR